jgi:hypothetical protein
MPSSPITPHITQPLYIIPHLAPQVRLDSHRRELGGDLVYCFCGELADSCAGEDGELCEDTGAVLCADAVEGFEAVLGGVRGGCLFFGRGRGKVPLTAGFRGSCFRE